MLKNENVYSQIFLKLMKNQYFQFFLRHWFLNLWRLINIWIWYLELAFIPLWLIRKKESDQIKIRKIILKLWVFELIWGKTFCSSFCSVENSYCFIPNLSSKTEPGKKIWEQQRRLLALGSQVSSHTHIWWLHSDLKKRKKML